MLWLPRSVHTSDCPCLTGLSGLRAFCNLGPAAQLEEAVELFMFAGRPRQALRILNQRLSDAAEPAASDATRGERCAARCRRAVWLTSRDCSPCCLRHPGSGMQSNLACCRCCSRLHLTGRRPTTLLAHTRPAAPLPPSTRRRGGGGSDQPWQRSGGGYGQHAGPGCGRGPRPTQPPTTHTHSHTHVCTSPCPSQSCCFRRLLCLPRASCQPPVWMALAGVASVPAGSRCPCPPPAPAEDLREVEAFDLLKSIRDMLAASSG